MAIERKRTQPVWIKKKTNQKKKEKTIQTKLVAINKKKVKKNRKDKG